MCHLNWVGKALFGLCLTFCHFYSFAQGKIEGTVADQEKNPITKASLLLVELKRWTEADPQGRFQFDAVPAGTYQLQVTSHDFGNQLATVEVTSGQATQIDIVFDVLFHEYLTVSATPWRKSISDVSQTVGILTHEQLQRKLQPTLGETLAQEPGVTSTYFGPGASRPIIRGLGGDRIRVLEGGLESGDASSISADHASSIDTLNVERIEVLRGPASLRYGSSAVGGVVNVVDNRIPEFVPNKDVLGAVEMRGNTVSDESGIGINLNGGHNRVAWHLDFSAFDTSDYEIPGHAEIEEEGEEEEEEPFNGTLENSALETQKGTAGLSYISDRGFIGVAVTRFDSEYGIPGHGEHGHGHEEGEEEEEEEEEEGEEEEFVTIDMEQKRIDVRGGLRFDNPSFQNLNIRLTRTDYAHTELEGEEIGTRFFNEYTELRAEAVHQKIWGLTNGSFGLQHSKRDFEAIGAEAFVLPNETDRTALFIYEEMDQGPWSINFGGRLERHQLNGSVAEHHEHEEEGHEEEEEEEEIEQFDLSFNGFSASFGFIYGQEKPFSVSANATHTERAPTAEELFSNGPHLATSSFEVGDPTLDSEKSLGLDVQLRHKTGPLTGELSFFSNRFDDYIYQQATGEMEDGLPEFEYQQRDASFHGGELHVDASLYHTDPHHLHLEFTYDFVRGELDSGGDLPRITPERWTISLEYKQPGWFVRTDIRRTEKQDRVAALETATEGYTMVHASLGYRFFVGGTIHHLLLRGNNLSDEEARVHTSFLKDRTLLPGRDLSLSYRLSF